jgi:hypothetical protein
MVRELKLQPVWKNCDKQYLWARIIEIKNIFIPGEDNSKRIKLHLVWKNCDKQYL